MFTQWIHLLYRIALGRTGYVVLCHEIARPMCRGRARSRLPVHRRRDD
jgi:hypothetical protein